MIPTNSYQRTVRGPYFSDRTADVSRTEVVQPTDYANQYNMVHLRGMFRLNRASNNGRINGGLK